MSTVVSIRLSKERYERLLKEANCHNKTIGAYIKNLLEDFDDICMQYYWDGVNEYKNGMIHEEILKENGII